MIVLLPLADNEEKRIITSNKVIELKTSQCEEPFNHIFFSEIGKLLHFWKNNNENFESICFIQNRRYFKDMESFPKLDDKTVYLAKFENIILNIEKQFLKCHPTRKRNI